MKIGTFCLTLLTAGVVVLAYAMNVSNNALIDNQHQMIGKVGYFLVAGTTMLLLAKKTP